MHNFCLIGKIFTGYIAWAFRHLHVKYLSDQMILKCYHKLVYKDRYTLNSTYNKVTFNEKSAVMRENLHTKYTQFTYNDVALNEKLPIMKQNLCIFFVIGGVECT